MAKNCWNTRHIASFLDVRRGTICARRLGPKSDRIDAKLLPPQRREKLLVSDAFVGQQ